MHATSIQIAILASKLVRDMLDVDGVKEEILLTKISDSPNSNVVDMRLVSHIISHALHPSKRPIVAGGAATGATTLVSSPETMANSPTTLHALNNASHQPGRYAMK